MNQHTPLKSKPLCHETSDGRKLINERIAASFALVQLIFNNDRSERDAIPKTTLSRRGFVFEILQCPEA